MCPVQSINQSINQHLTINILFLLYYGALTIASFSCLYTDWSKACFYRSVRAVRSFVCLLLNL